MSNLDNLINPTEFSGTELLKLVYRDLQLFRQEFEDYKRANNHTVEMQEMRLKIQKLENELEIVKKLGEERSRVTKGAIAIASFVIIGLEFLLKFFFKV